MILLIYFYKKCWNTVHHKAINLIDVNVKGKQNGMRYHLLPQLWHNLLVMVGEPARQTSVLTSGGGRHDAADVCGFISSVLQRFFPLSSLGFFSRRRVDPGISPTNSAAARDLENDVSRSPKLADEIGMIDGVSFVRVIRLHYTSSCARLYVPLYGCYHL